ncbi:MAG: hypothetical protein GY755_23105 [Chloroflexi bacterium]|nr:hypothetical protein [Chloroflexota bacterium]
MSHTIAYNAEEKIIDIKFEGDLTWSEVKKVISETMQYAKEENCFLILNDMREATMKLSTLEIYNLPQNMSEMLASSGLHVHKFKRAFVAAKDLKDYSFFETVTLNRGQFAKMFFDIREAKKWLLENNKNP